MILYIFLLINLIKLLKIRYIINNLVSLYLSYYCKYSNKYLLIILNVISKLFYFFLIKYFIFYF